MTRDALITLLRSSRDEHATTVHALEYALTKATLDGPGRANVEASLTRLRALISRISVVVDGN